MFSQQIFDPTAGETTRLLYELPPRYLPILDPTDPRYGLDALGRDRVIPPEPGRSAANDTHAVHFDS